MNSIESINVTTLAGAFGAEISGIDLSRETNGSEFQEVEKALLAHKLLVFRDQALDPAALPAASEFGAPCADTVEHTDCGPPADHCAMMPGQTVGNCTATGCIDNATVCPGDWSCLDLSAFLADQPAICVAP